MKKFTRFLVGLLAVVTAVFAIGCGSTVFDKTEDVIVVQREAGSGTREAFEKAFDLTDKVVAALDANTTGAVFAAVSGNEYAIGYASSGLVRSDVKRIKVDGVDATDENIVSGAYTYQRPFNMITKAGATLTVLQQDFLNFVYSTDGQSIVAAAGFVQAQTADGATGAAYVKSADLPTSGKLTVTGSTSVQPVMNQLLEAYVQRNSGISTECSGTGSGQGKTDIDAGTSDFGIVSSALKTAETEKYTAYKIAIDGIALVVNPLNPVEDLTKAQVVQLFSTPSGTENKWSAVIA